MALNIMLPDMSYGKMTKKCYQVPLVVDSGDFSGQPLDSVGKSRNSKLKKTVVIWKNI